MTLVYLSSDDQEKKNKICDLFNKSLVEQKEEGSTEALVYLNNRGITKEIIKDFKIGFYPKNREVPGLSPLFKGRVILPIIDEYGDTRSFSGRLIYKSEKELKYFHESYPKGFFLYGINLAWQEILKQNKVIIVEGQMDVLSMHKAGIRNTVGIMGSSLKMESFIKLSRFCDEFVLCLDPDKSGIKGAEKAEKLLKKFKRKTTNVLLKTEEGEFDPDNFCIKYGDKGIKKIISYFERKGQEKKWTIPIPEI